MSLMKRPSVPGRRWEAVLGLRRSSFAFGVAVAIAVSSGCTESESFFPPLASSGAGAGGGAGNGGASATGGTAGTGNVGAGSGGSSGVGSGGVASTAGVGATGGLGGASAGSAGNGGVGAGGTPVNAGGTSGANEGGQANETGDGGESVGGAGLGGTAGISAGSSGASGSAGTTAGSAGAGAGGVAGTAGSGGVSGSGGSAGNCASTERCDGIDNDCDGDPDEGAVCPAGCDARQHDGHVYILCDHSNQNDYLDYAEATDWCADAGAELELGVVFELARIESSEENAFVKTWIADTSGVGMIWFGANDLDQERIWVWGRGDEAVQFFTGSAQGGGMPYMGAFDDFAAGRPSNGTGEDCGAFDSEFDWQWNDLACANGRRGFVCEEQSQ